MRTKQSTKASDSLILLIARHARLFGQTSCLVALLQDISNMRFYPDMTRAIVSVNYNATKFFTVGQIDEAVAEIFKLSNSYTNYMQVIQDLNAYSAKGAKCKQ